MAGNKAKATKPQGLNRQLRTRKDILHAASRLLKDGRGLTMDQIAKEALVSRATAYRYFADVADIMAEVAIDQSVPDPKEALGNIATVSILERLDRAESVMHDFVYQNEQQLRLLLSRSLLKQLNKGSDREIPARQNRRTEYINEALAPYQADFTAKSLNKLKEALALVFGPEAMIVFRDVIPITPKRAREVKSWAIKGLIEAALKESRDNKKRKK